MSSELWEQIKNKICSQDSGRKAELWFRQMQAREEGDKLIITCANPMIYQYVNKFYLKQIAEAVASVSSMGNIVIEQPSGENVSENVGNFVGKSQAAPVRNLSGSSGSLNNNADQANNNSHRQISGVSSAAPAPSSASARGAASASASKKRTSNHIIRFSHSKSESSDENKARYVKSKTFENFVQGSSNSLAFMHAKKVASKPGIIDINPLVLLGKTGLGKTHLLYAIGNEICRNTDYNVVYVNSTDFLQDFTQIFGAANTAQQVKSAKLDELKNFYCSADVLLVDDIQFIAKGEKTQEQFFYIIKELFENLKQIVVTCDTYPKEIQKLDNRIISRLDEGVVTEITIPQYEERIAIISSKAHELGIKIPNDINEFIARIIVSNVRAIEGAVKSIKSACESKGIKTITMDLVKDALAVQIQSRDRLINGDDIIRIVASRFSISISLLKSDRRYQNVAYPRNLAMYVMRTLTDKSLQEIGEIFGGKNHSTVLTACKKIGKRLEDKESKVCTDYQFIIDQLNI